MSKNAPIVVAPNLKKLCVYVGATKNRGPAENPESASAGLFGSLTIGLPVHEPAAIEPGSIVLRDLL